MTDDHGDDPSTARGRSVAISFPYTVRVHDPLLLEPTSTGTPAGDVLAALPGTAQDQYVAAAVGLLRTQFPQCSISVQVADALPADNGTYANYVHDAANNKYSACEQLNGNEIALRANQSTSANDRPFARIAPSQSTSSPASGRDDGALVSSYVVRISGPPGQVSGARGVLLRGNPSQISVVVRADRAVVFNHARKLRPLLKERFEVIKATTGVQITILGQHYLADPSMARPPPGLSSSDAAIDVEIAGPWENVQQARVQCLVALDEAAGLHISTVSFDPKLHALVAGEQRSRLSHVMQTTMTNVYFPTPFAGTLFEPLGTRAGESASSEADSDAQQKQKAVIYVSGTREGVERAKKMMLDDFEAVKSHVQYRSVKCLPRKTEWLAANCRDYLAKVMHDNAVTIVLPAPGLQNTTLHVYGSKSSNIERAIRAVMRMTCEVYIACLQLDQPVVVDLPIPREWENVYAALLPVALRTGAEILCKGAFVEIYGTETHVKAAYSEFTSLPEIKAHLRDTKFQLEVDLQQKEFVEGKKFGKLSKITAASGCKIAFHDRYNDFNLLMDVIHPHPSCALEGLRLLEAELPAEVSFCVPEIHHKRIIGISGKNIQKIMKKFGVYVKFCSADEFRQLGGYYERQDNVIARTPAKNAYNLGGFKRAIVELIAPNQEADTDVWVDVPRHLHRVVQGTGGSHVREIEGACKCAIAFPEKEWGADTVRVHGSPQSAKKARAMLVELVPQSLELAVAVSAAAHGVLTSAEFAKVEETLCEYNVSMYTQASRLLLRRLAGEGSDAGAILRPSLLATPSASPHAGYLDAERGAPQNRLGEFSVFLYYFKDVSQLDAAVELVTKFLEARQIPVVASGPAKVASGRTRAVTIDGASSTIVRPTANASEVGTGAPPAPGSLPSTGSYDSFAHFNSKLIAPIGASSSVGRPTEKATPEVRPGLVFGTSMPTGAGSGFFQGSHAASDGFAASAAVANAYLSRAHNGAASPSLRALFESPPSAVQLLAGSPRVTPNSSPRASPRVSPLGGPSPIGRAQRAHTTSGVPLSRPGFPGSATDPARETSALGAFTSRRGSASSWADPTSSPTPAQLSFGHQRLAVPEHAAPIAAVPENSLAEKSSSSCDLLALSTSDAERILAAAPKDQMAVLLNALDLEKYQELLAEEEVDLATFLTMDNQDFKDLGVGAFGARKKMANAISDLRMLREAQPGSVDGDSAPGAGLTLLEGIMGQATNGSGTRKSRSGSTYAESRSAVRPTPAPNARRN